MPACSFKMAKHQKSGSWAPWRQDDFDYGFGYVALHREIEHFCTYMLPTPVERGVRKNLIQRIDAVVKSVWPDATTEVYGSVRMDLYLPTSDIDIVIFGHAGDNPWERLRTELIRSGIARASSTSIFGTAVPIISFQDTLTRLRLDISFNIKTSTQTVDLIKAFKRKYPVLPKLVIVLKEFLKERNLSKVYKGGLASYSLTLLCISFLQLHPRPNVVKNGNLGVLLVQFLELYGSNFNYAKLGISITDGGGYFQKKTWSKNDHNTPMPLCIEDPLLRGKNVSSGSFAYESVQFEFEQAYLRLSITLSPHSSNGQAEQNTSMLATIINIDRDEINYRKWLNESFRYMGVSIRPARQPIAAAKEHADETPKGAFVEQQSPTALVV